jgi:hypothetical protein
VAQSSATLTIENCARTKRPSTMGDKSPKQQRRNAGQKTAEATTKDQKKKASAPVSGAPAVKPPRK